ncbi:hypothetical protein [Streptomyces sp. x-19]|uniref:hypothetical protein n=1 Tax=Streptomyces sp. x-19 TaxID=2789280 RepID=UPI0039807FF7
MKSPQLRAVAGDFAADQWRALSRLDALEDFSFGPAEGVSAFRIPQNARLPQVKTLSLINTGNRPVPEFGTLLPAALPTFPHVHTLQLYGLVGGPIGLSPAPALPALQNLHLTLFPRPRT